jgi:alkanesulfonate monooxygenase SsuD/methylene tetrahydromethanopterin reductase-like flavin-dependent oxidoreductase (luciferase family)
MTGMQLGVMLRGVFPWGEDMRVRFEELMEQARLMNRLGYDSLTKGMHYSTYPMHEMQQLPFLARVMAEAPDLRLNAGIVLLALQKPLGIAEEFATLDLMSGGKMIFGCALGYRDVEYKAFGLNRGQGVKRFEENLEAVKQLWTGEPVNMKGSHFELVDAQISTPLVQKPHPPIWVGANADRAVERAARVGDCWYVNPHQRLDTLERQLDLYRRALDAAGKPFPAEFPIRREVFCAPTHEEAIRIAGPFLKDMYEAYEEWGQDKVMPEGDNDISMRYEELARDRFIVGTPDEVAEEMLRYNRVLGVNHIIMSVQGTGLPQSQVLETLELMATEVFPKVRQGM